MCLYKEKEANATAPANTIASWVDTNTDSFPNDSFQYFADNNIFLRHTILIDINNNFNFERVNIAS